MKKLAMISCVILILMFSGCAVVQTEGESTMPAIDNISDTSPAEKTENPITNSSALASANRWVNTYMDVINKLIEQYGEGAIEPNNIDEENHMIGVGIIRLIDFDGDGTEELYCAYQDTEGLYVNKQIIYGYNNGPVVLLEECDVSNPGTDISPSTTFLTKDGLVYLVDVNEIADGKYYTLQNGKMISVLTYHLAWDEDEQSTVNGVAAMRKEVEIAIEEMNANGVLDRISFAYDVDYAEIEKTKEIIEGIKNMSKQQPNP